ATRNITDRVISVTNHVVAAALVTSQPPLASSHLHPFRARNRGRVPLSRFAVYPLLRQHQRLNDMGLGRGSSRRLGQLRRLQERLICPYVPISWSQPAMGSQSIFLRTLSLCH